jgi:hypothetical protein
MRLNAVVLRVPHVCVQDGRKSEKEHVTMHINFQSEHLKGEGHDKQTSNGRIIIKLAFEEYDIRM